MKKPFFWVCNGMAFVSSSLALAAGSTDHVRVAIVALCVCVASLSFRAIVKDFWLL